MPKGKPSGYGKPNSKPKPKKEVIPVFVPRKKPGPKAKAKA